MLSKQEMPHRLLNITRHKYLNDNGARIMVFIYSSSVTTLTFQFNAMLVSQVEDIVSHFSFHRDPLA